MLVPPCSVDVARPEEFPDAFLLVFQHLPPAERQSRVTNALNLVGGGEFDPRGLFVARGPAGLLGALVCQAVPGACGLVWPPQTRNLPHADPIADSLLRHACDWLRGRGARLAQAVLGEDEQPLAAPLERHGFRRLTSLWHLRHPLRNLPSLPRVAHRLLFLPYPDVAPSQFHQTLLRTYEGTLDCPEVNGLRTAEEILEGHQAQGRFDPRRWWLTAVDDQPVGVLLLAEMPEWQALDVSYVGVVPEARRHGWGEVMVRRALREAKSAGAVQATLSVDGRNQPACRLYRRLGFEPFDRREVYLAVWRRSSEG